MNISKQDRDLLSEIIQQQLMQAWSANRAEKARLSSKHGAKPHSFLRRLVFWRGARNRREEEEPIPVAQRCK
jgi:hypothetical protein